MSDSHVDIFSNKDCAIIEDGMDRFLLIDWNVDSISVRGGLLRYCIAS